MSFFQKIRHAWKDRSDEHDHNPDPSSRRDLDLQTIESLPFQWLIVFVAGLGFLADGYLLFASNFVLPILDYVYWRCDTRSNHETAINTVTLAGSVLGQIVLGFMADHYGRRKVYGWELCLLILGTLGATLAAQVSPNDVGGDSLNIYSLLIFWRFLVGVGLGAEYPTTAVIASEWAPTHFRARMLASVFAMQPLGQFLVAIVALILVECNVSKDSMWRWIFGLGAVPAAVVLVMRASIPESPRYTFDVDRNPRKANADIFDVKKSPRKANADISVACAQIQGLSTERTTEDDRDALPETSKEPAHAISESLFPPTASRADFYNYFFTQGNWRHLVATSGTWFLLDLSFYGLGLNSPQIIAKLWNDPSEHNATFFTGSPPTNSSCPNRTIPLWDSEASSDAWTVFRDNAYHAVILVSLGAMSGSLLLIWLVDHMSRRRLQIGSFSLLAVLFLTIGLILWVTSQNSESLSVVIIILYVIAQFLFNLGPNGLTFIFPAEIFPTRYRCTCHGISAAAGKLGSIVAQLALSGVHSTKVNQSDIDPKSLGKVLIGLACATAVGASLSLLLPEVQDPQRRNKTLEQLAEGRRGDR